MKLKRQEDSNQSTKQIKRYLMENIPASPINKCMFITSNSKSSKRSAAKTQLNVLRHMNE